MFLVDDPVYNHNSSHESLNILLSSLVAIHVSTRVDNQVGVSVGSVGSVGLDSTFRIREPEDLEHISDLTNNLVLTTSRSSSFSSEYTESYSPSTNGSITNEDLTVRSFYINENPTDSNTQTMLVGRSRLEYLEYLNENISSIIAEAVQNSEQ